MAYSLSSGPRRATTFLVAASFSAAALAGCSASSPPPQEQLQEAGVKKAQGASFLARGYLVGAQQDVETFLAEGASEVSPEEKQSISAAASTLLKSSVTVEGKTVNGQPLASQQDLKNLNYGVFVDTEGERQVSLLKMNPGFYVNLPGSKLLESFGVSKEQLTQWTSEVSTPWVKQLLAGKWLALDSALSQELSQTLEKEAAESPTPAAVFSALQQNTAFPPEGEGTFTASLNVAGFSKALGGDAKTVKEGATIPVTYTLEEKELKKVKVHLKDVSNAFASEGDSASQYANSSLALIVDFGQDTPSLNLPSDAAPVSKKDLETFFPLDGLAD